MTGDIVHVRQLDTLESIVADIEFHVSGKPEIMDLGGGNATVHTAEIQVPKSFELLSLIGQTGDGVIALDREGRFTYVNPTAARLLARPGESLIGDYSNDLFPEAKDEQIQSSVLTDQPTLTLEIHGYSALLGGNFEFHVHPTEDGGKLLLFRDASKRRDREADEQAENALQVSEERLAESQSAAHIGSWERDLATGRLTWTREMFRLLDFDPADGEPTQEEVAQRIHPEDRPLVDSAAEKAFETGESYKIDFRVMRNDGSLTWVEARFRNVCRDGAGSAAAPQRGVHLAGTLQNITARKTIEMQKDEFLQKAIEISDHDPLTDLHNHRAFHYSLRAAAERLTRERARSGSTGSTTAEALSVGVIVLDMDNFKYFNDTHGHLTGDEVLCQAAEAIRSCCGEWDTPARIGGDEFAICLPRTTRDAYQKFLVRLRSTVDSLVFHPTGQATAIPLRLSIGAALFPEDASTSADALYLADKRAVLDKGSAHDSEADRLRAELSQELDGFSMLDALVAAVDNKDRYTRRHSEEVMVYCAVIAESMGLDHQAKSSLQTAALVHDVGKIGVPNRVLRLPAKLNAAQFDVVKRHPVLGGILVAAVPELEHTLGAVRHHHERWDGCGYPSGLAGLSIPLSARIMAVADAYSAMTNDRPYRKGMQDIDARQILAEGAGTQWDPDCVRAFLGCNLA